MKVVADRLPNERNDQKQRLRMAQYAWSRVVAAMRFEGFTSSQEATIKGSLQAVYVTSAGQALINSFVDKYESAMAAGQLEGFYSDGNRNYSNITLIAIITTFKTICT